VLREESKRAPEILHRKLAIDGMLTLNIYSLFQAADAHVGQVREFATPSAPKAPAVPSSSELASQLQSYSSSEPDHAEAEKAASSGESSGDREDVNAFLANAAADIKVEAAHH
jgi:F-type H+-transporting ATPase subunit h